MPHQLKIYLAIMTVMMWPAIPVFWVFVHKGLYILNENDRKIIPSRPFLANQIYTPSYVSTEYALYYYDLIPERVVDLTSFSQ